MLHELCEKETTLHFCKECGPKLSVRFKNKVSAMFLLRTCDICQKVAICSVSSPMVKSEKWVHLNEDGTPKDMYVEREGV